jgi:hypothetical protein
VNIFGPKLPLNPHLTALIQEGIMIAGREDSDYGRFAWIMDPENRRIELWEPPAKPAVMTNDE